MPSHLLVTLAIISFMSAAAIAQSIGQSTSGPYGTYSLFPQGSVRALGMGGASTALSDDAAGITQNPAGLGFGKWKSDFSATNNTVENFEATFSDFGSGFSAVSVDEYNYKSYAAAARMGKLFFGAGVSSPYSTQLSETVNSFSSQEATTKELQLTDIDGLIGYRFDKVSVAVAIHQQTAKYTYESPSITTVEKASSPYYTIGAIYRTEKFGVGFSLVTERNIDFNDDLNQQLPEDSIFVLENDFWFNDIQGPARRSFGLFYQISQITKLAIDYDMYDAPKNLIFTGSKTSTSTVTDFGTPLANETRTVLHGGLEMALVKESDTDFIFRIGGYNEPSRLQTGIGVARRHWTAGFEVRFGPLVLSLASDQAEGFKNITQGFSVNLGSI